MQNRPGLLSPFMPFIHSFIKNVHSQILNQARRTYWPSLGLVFSNRVTEKMKLELTQSKILKLQDLLPPATFLFVSHVAQAFCNSMPGINNGFNSTFLLSLLNTDLRLCNIDIRDQHLYHSFLDKANTHWSKDACFCIIVLCTIDPLPTDIRRVPRNDLRTD